MKSRGIINIGNTCYLNSVIQCLTHLFIFNNENIEFLSEVSKVDNQLMHEWLQIQNDLVSKGQAVNPSDFIEEFMNTIKNHNYYFDSFNQNDASEFITILLESFHEAIKTRKKMRIEGKPETNFDKLAINSMKSWISFFKDNYSFVIQTTYSQLISKISCPKCNYITYNHDPIQIITLPVKENYTTIYDCLDLFIKENILDGNNTWKCDQCNHYVNATEQKMLWNASHVLILQLKLYTNSLFKMNTKLDYPDILDITNYNINYNNTNNNYKLYGICCQSGNLNSGHYYSICYNKYDHQWRRYNDSDVSHISLNEALNEIPYCLFYMKQ